MGQVLQPARDLGALDAASSRCKSRLAFVLISKLYRQMYANTGIATDSARVSRSAQWARLIARHTRRLFVAPPMPDLTAPEKTAPRRAASLARQATTQTASPASL